MERKTGAILCLKGRGNWTYVRNVISYRASSPDTEMFVSPKRDEAEGAFPQLHRHRHFLGRLSSLYGWRVAWTGRSLVLESYALMR